MKIKLALLFLLFTGVVWGQEFRGKERVYITPYANDKYPVYYSSRKIYDTIQKVFDKNGNLLSFQLTAKTDWKDAKKLDTILLRTPKYNYNCKSLRANIVPQGERLLVYFWENGKLNDSLKIFLSENSFSIPLESNKNLSVFTDSFHLGAMTLPIKIYLNRRDEDVKGGMVETGINVGVYAGYKFGWKKYVKLKHEDNYRIYTKAFSINLILGASKITVDDKNSVGYSQTKKEDLPAFITGLSMGLHYRDFSFLLASGFDILLSSGGDNWNYKDKPWLGIGFGYKIF